MKSYEVTLHQGTNTLALRGDINPGSRKIILESPTSQSLIRDIATGVATFTTTTGVTSVTVGETRQVSGATPNDFRGNLEYTLAGNEGDSVTYTVEIFASPQTTGLPVIHVDTKGRAIPDKTNYVPCTVTVSDPNDPANDTEIVNTSDGIRLRGNSTMGYDKKPYRLKFDKKASMFGLGEAKSWVLLANYLDPTLLASTVAFELGNRFATRRTTKSFVNSATHVELFISGEYMGSYLFTEQVQVNEYRVNIDEKKDYFLELDSYYDETNKFKIAMFPGGTELPVNIQSPEDDRGAAALPAIRADMQLLVDYLTNNKRFDGPDARYADLIDMTSTVDFIMINEIVGNKELQHPKSTYMYKVLDGRWCFGPLWDFDWGFGYSGSGFSYFKDPTTFYFSSKTNFKGDPRAGNVFFTQFFLDAGFRAAYKARWNEMKPHFSTIDAFVGEMGDKLARSAAQNKKRWNGHYAQIDYSTEITGMKNYMTTRINYLDGVINAVAW
jgi:hypothetical protein